MQINGACSALHPCRQAEPSLGSQKGRENLLPKGAVAEGLVGSNCSVIPEEVMDGRYVYGAEGSEGDRHLLSFITVY